MNFPVIIAVCMIAIFNKQAESRNSTFVVHVKRYFPEAPGTCFDILCEPSTKGLTYDCCRHFIKDNQPQALRVYGLKVSEKDSHEFFVYKNGVNTNETGKLDFEDNVLIWVRRNVNGDIVQVLCGTLMNDADAATEAKLARKCNFPVDIKDLDDKNC